MIKFLLLFLALTIELSLPAANLAETLSDTEGGVIKVQSKGFVAVVDCRLDSAKCEYQLGIDHVAQKFRVRICRTTAGLFSLSKAGEMLEKSGGNVAVFVVDDKDIPLTLSSPEAKWSLLNIASLRCDNPTGETMQRRASLMLIRQVCRALGSDTASQPGCCMYSVYSLEDLDKIKSYDLLMGPFVSSMENLQRLGMSKIEQFTYLDACQEGWAPPPTNDVQKAIWEKVHAPPKTPLKIKFDPATQKGKVTK